MLAFPKCLSAGAAVFLFAIAHQSVTTQVSGFLLTAGRGAALAPEEAEQEFMSTQEIADMARLYSDNSNYPHWLTEDELKMACAEYQIQHGMRRDPGYGNELLSQRRGGNFRGQEFNEKLVNTWLDKTEYGELFAEAEFFTKNLKGHCMVAMNRKGNHWERLYLTMHKTDGQKFSLQTRDTQPDGMCGAHAAFGTRQEDGSSDKKIVRIGASKENSREEAAAKWHSLVRQHINRALRQGPDAEDNFAWQRVEFLIEQLLREVVADRRPTRNADTGLVIGYHWRKPIQADSEIPSGQWASHVANVFNLFGGEANIQTRWADAVPERSAVANRTVAEAVNARRRDGGEVPRSRNPLVPSGRGVGGRNTPPLNQMTEEEQIQLAIAMSLKDGAGYGAIEVAA